MYVQVPGKMHWHRVHYPRTTEKPLQMQRTKASRGICCKVSQYLVRLSSKLKLFFRYYCTMFTAFHFHGVSQAHNRDFMHAPLTCLLYVYLNSKSFSKSLRHGIRPFTFSMYIYSVYVTSISLSFLFSPSISLKHRNKRYVIIIQELVMAFLDFFVTIFC